MRSVRMPVASFSRSSISARMPRISLERCRASSSCLSYPSRITPPSFSGISLSGSMAEPMSRATSSRGSMFCSISRSRAHCTSPSSSLMAGRRAVVAPRAIISFTGGLPYTTRVISRSRSYTPSKAAASSLMRILFRVSSVTAFSRRLMALTDKSGCSIELLSSRRPIEVLVLSSTQKSVPRFSRLRIVSVSSRFRRIYSCGR